MNKQILLILAAVLIFVGLFKPTFITNIVDGNTPVSVVTDDIEVTKPTSDLLLEKSKDVIQALSVSGDRKIDGKKLAKLYLDMATLISLDGEDEVIKGTEDIRQANAISGLMLDLDMKGKYPDLAAANKSLIVSVVGDDQVLLSKELREQAVDAFQALAWACYEGSK